MYKQTKDQQFIKSLDFITNIKYLNISNIWNQIFQIFQNKYQIFHIKYFKYLISNIKPPDFITMPSSLFLYVWFSFRLFCHIPLHHHIISYQVLSYHIITLWRCWGRYTNSWFMSLNNVDSQEMFVKICLTWQVWKHALL